jgi:hypothetical protein
MRNMKRQVERLKDQSIAERENVSPLFRGTTGTGSHTWITAPPTESPFSTGTPSRGFLLPASPFLRRKILPTAACPVGLLNHSGRYDVPFVLLHQSALIHLDQEEARETRAS